MVWVFYSSQIFLLGAEFTWLYAHSHGSRAGENVRRAAEAPVATRPGRALNPAWETATAVLLWVGFGAIRALLRRPRA
jgi:membrane protein